MTRKKDRKVRISLRVAQTIIMILMILGPILVATLTILMYQGVVSL